MKVTITQREIESLEHTLQLVESEAAALSGRGIIEDMKAIRRVVLRYYFELGKRDATNEIKRRAK